MKKLVLIAFALAALTLCTHQANALSITVNEDSATRLDFVVAWDDFSVASATYAGTHSDVSVGFSFPLSVAILAVPPFPPLGDGFIVYLSSGDVFDFLTDFEGTEYSIAADGLSGRFIYGEPLPSNGVPDAGSSLGLLGIGLLGLVSLRRKLARA